MRYILKNERGSTLVLILLITVVLTILGMALISVSLANTKSTMRQENSIKSYFVARSAAMTLAEHIVSNPTVNVAGMVSAGIADPIDIADGMVSINVTNPTENQLIISSTGTVNGVSQNVDVILDKTVGKLFDFSILAMNTIEITNHVTIHGQVATNALKSSNPYSMGNGSTPSLDNVIFNAGVDIKDIVEPPLYYPIYNNKTTNSFNDTVLGEKHVLFNQGIDLGTKKEINISGSGVYNMYIKNGLKLSNHSAIVPSAGVTIMIYVLDDSDVVINSSYIKAVIYAPESTVKFHNSSGNKIGGRSFHGSIIAKDVYIHGNKSVFDYNPDADTEEPSIEMSYQIIQVQ